ncbi:MAG: ABC transporter permease [Gemmatimonas sp.]
MMDFTRRVWYFLRRDQVTRDLEEEMRIHVELRAESLRRLRRDESTAIDASSHSRSFANDPAYTDARQRFGNTTQHHQRSQDMWGFGRLEDLNSDVRFAVRRLAQRPAFTVAVVGVMAIGIGATTAMFSAVDAALLRPLPFRKPEQLAVLNVSIKFEDPAGKLSLGNRGFYSTDADSMKTTFSDVATYGAGALDLADPEHPFHLNVGVVTTNFFQTLGVQPLVGRAFVAGEGKEGVTKVVMLSYGIWQRVYGGRDVKGLKITMAQESHEVIGVMPAGFSFPRESDVWIPMSIPHTTASFRAFGGSINATTIGRLQPGIDVAAASARLMARWQQIRSAQPPNGEDFVTRDLIEKGAATPLQQTLVGDRKTALLVLLGATGLLLLVACVNVTNLLLSHAQARAREISVRQVLGATRTRIVRQLLTESVVLALGGAILGTLVAPLALGMITVLMPKSLAGLSPAHIDLRILAFATLLALFTGIAFGLWPALGSARNDNSDVIKSGGGHGSTSARGGRARRLLVGAELALTTALLIGSGLMLQSFRALMSRETGMLPPHVGTMQLSFPRTAGSDVDRKRRMDEILNRFAAMPDIAAAGFVNDLPLGTASVMSLRLNIEGAAPLTLDSKDPLAVMTRWIVATGGYFPAMGVKLLRGRLFTENDGPNAPKVAIISERMAKTYWPDQEALGRTFTMPMLNVPFTVVGIVSDVRDYKLESEPQMQLYQSAYASTPSTAALVVRSQIPERELLARMQSVVRAVDPSQAVFALRMMEDVVDISVAPRRTNTLLISVFALLALALASVGIYAVVSYGVSHRSRELGIRSALGATGSNLMQMISSEMVWVVVLGIASGLVGAWALAKTLENLVYGVSVHDPFTFVVVPLVLIVPVVFATLVPTRRVLRVDPAQVMRAD